MPFWNKPTRQPLSNNSPATASINLPKLTTDDIYEMEDRMLKVKDIEVSSPPELTLEDKQELIRKQNVSVEEIHSDFNSMTEKLIAEYNAQLNLLNRNDYSKAERLNKLGFINHPEVEKLREIEVEKGRYQKVIDKLEKVKRYFPFNKVITKEHVKTLCEKYNLVFGEIYLYKGDVPDKNIKEMEDFLENNNFPAIMKIHDIEEHHYPHQVSSYSYYKPSYYLKDDIEFFEKDNVSYFKYFNKYIGRVLTIEIKKKAQLTDCIKYENTSYEAYEIPFKKEFMIVAPHPLLTRKQVLCKLHLFYT